MAKRTRGPDKRPRKKRGDNPRVKNRGPGRAEGQSNALPMGAVAAIRSMRHRIPDDIPTKLAKDADDAYSTIVKVMHGKIKDGVKYRLAAARVVREEICGPIPKTHEHKGSITVNVNTGVPRNPDDPVEQEPARVGVGKDGD